jgi:hypothetical protein
MISRAYAVTADENGQFQAAAASYEAALESDPSDVEATVNLAVLYWRAVRAALPPEFCSYARERLAVLLTTADERFAGRAEVRFWRSHIAATDAGSPLEPDECRRLLEERPDYLEPAFVVFLDSAGVDAEPEAMRLLVDYTEQPTARGRYVTSVIHAVMQKRRRLAMGPTKLPSFPA